MDELKLISPVRDYYHKIEVLFKDDPKVRVTFDDDRNTIRLYVDGDIKAMAISQILPWKKVFGNISVYTEIVPSNSQQIVDLNTFKQAFDGNPAVAYITTMDRPVGGNHGYVVFRNKVVQYFNDDISDINGFRSTLYQDIAREVFGQSEEISFCTDKPEE